MGLIKCEDCGQMISDKAKCCPNCGCPNPYIAKEENPSSQGSDFNLTDTGQSGKSRIAFGLFGILFACFGVHLFYIGKTKAGILNILLSVIGCILIFPPAIIHLLGLIQGILALTMTQEEFERRYVYSEKFYPF